MNVRQMSSADRCDDVSSSANSTPPTGAPSAAAIPAPVPTQIKSRRSLPGQRGIERTEACAKGGKHSRVSPHDKATFLVSQADHNVYGTDRSLWKRESIDGENSKQRFLNLSPRVTPDAMPAPICIMGPSGPQANPLVTEHIEPNIFTKMVLRLKNR